MVREIIMDDIQELSNVKCKALGENLVMRYRDNWPFLVVWDMREEGRIFFWKHSYMEYSKTKYGTCMSIHISDK